MKQETIDKKISKFWDKVEKTGYCWNWKGSINSWQYGQVRINNRYWRVHRLAYTLLVGEIPQSKVLDHLCRNRICVNPNHLEPVTNKENVLRGKGLTALNSQKTLCIRGHNLDGFNLYITPSGYRNCKKCRQISGKRWSNRVRQASET